jgi:uncharacterized protein YdeI (YjbR/CyaY-like superfamily)
LVLARGGATKPTTLTHPQALEEALCFGWIDGQARSRDAASWCVRFTRRRSRSPWSRRNTVIADRLRREGRMHSAGMAEIARAKSDGRWQAAYEGAATIEVPEDLRQALRAEPSARSMFDRLSGSNRYAILYRIQTAKRPQTRARRIQQFVAMLARGETLYPQSRTTR